MASTLFAIDSLEITVIVDNELDPISKYIEPVTAFGNLAHVGLAGPVPTDERGDGVRELNLENVCCGAHGLSLLLVRVSILKYHHLTMLDCHHG
jgi:7,8-dihydropterin-6-yl-methyl-4-(beta-D-ribofuranosyl)aminobenzene 5'-phosphate synthase